MEFEKFFEAEGQSKKEWDDHRTSPGSCMHGWLAREDDYKAEGPVGDYLRGRGGLKAISDLVLESTIDRHNMVVKLFNEIDLKNENLDQLQIKYKEMKTSLSRICDERDEIHKAFCEEIKKKQLTTLEHIRNISEEQETLILEIKRLDSWSRELSKREALAERERQKLEEEKTKVIHCLCSMQHCSYIYADSIKSELTLSCSSRYLVPNISCLRLVLSCVFSRGLLWQTFMPFTMKTKWMVCVYGVGQVIASLHSRHAVSASVYM